MLIVASRYDLHIRPLAGLKNGLLTAFASKGPSVLIVASRYDLNIRPLAGLKSGLLSSLASKGPCARAWRQNDILDCMELGEDFLPRQTSLLDSFWEESNRRSDLLNKAGWRGKKSPPHSTLVRGV